MEDGECKKNFPKPFREETAENVNGYPAYRRRNNGRTVQIGGLVADNSYVVPYNKDLLKKYRAHINIEACATVKSVKYTSLSMSIRVTTVLTWRWRWKRARLEMESNSTSTAGIEYLHLI